MTHEEIKILISAYCDGEVTPSEKVIVEEHLSICESCQKDLKMYQSMSSSLSRWPDESLSPDAAIKVQQRIEQRRESMFSQRNVMSLGTTLALTIIVGTVFYHFQLKGLQGGLKTASDNIAYQYSPQNEYHASNLSSEGVNEKRSLAQEAAQLEYAPDNERMGYQSAGATHFVLPHRAAMANPIYSARLMGSDASVRHQGAGYLASAFPVTEAMREPLAQERISNYYQNSTASYYDINDEERKKIQRADISLQVDNAFKTKSQLTDLILQFNGIILSSEFSRSDDGAGRGNMVCKVYPKDLENALQQIRKLGEVENENEASSDVTDQYNEVQDNVSKYTVEKARLQKTLNDFKLFNPTTDEERENAKIQIDQTTREIKALEREIKFYQVQTSMSLIVVNFYDVYKNTLKVKNDSSQWKNVFENKWKNTKNISLEVFANILFGIVYLLSYIVPVLIWCIIFAVIYFIVRMFFKK